MACGSPELIRLSVGCPGEPALGRPHIHSELLLLGYDVAEATVAKYMTRRGRRPPSQTWRTFLRNHLRHTAACDFFVVPTATFRLLFCFVICPMTGGASCTSMSPYTRRRGGPRSRSGRPFPGGRHRASLPVAGSGMVRTATLSGG